MKLGNYSENLRLPMPKQTDGSVYHSSLLMTFSGIVSGYSTRTLGDMRIKGKEADFTRRLHLNPENLVRIKQIHGNKIRVVTDRDYGKQIADTDGLVCNSHILKRIPVLSVHVADCVPIVAVDLHTRIYGVAHAGWKGTLLAVASNLIAVMKREGATPSNIYVSLGPHICGSCYNVYAERAIKFQKLFGMDTDVAKLRKKKWHLDLGIANTQQLLEAGVLESHIDVCSLCTSCRNEMFYSYRKDSHETFGEIAGVISVQ